MRQLIFIFLLSPLIFFTQKVEVTFIGLSEKPENITSSNFNQAYTLAKNKWLASSACSDTILEPKSKPPITLSAPAKPPGFLVN